MPAPVLGKPQVARRGELCFFFPDSLPERGPWADNKPLPPSWDRVLGPQLLCRWATPQPWGSAFPPGKEKVRLWMASKGPIFKRFHWLRVEKAKMAMCGSAPLVRCPLPEGVSSIHKALPSWTPRQVSCAVIPPFSLPHCSSPSPPTP